MRMWMMVVALAATGCANEASIGTNPDAAITGKIGVGDRCTWTTSTLCDDGLFCDLGDDCVPNPEGGCEAEGYCVPLRGYGEPCESVEQCADADGFCAGSGGDSACYPPAVGDERCEDDLDCAPGRLCVRSYCLLRQGEECSAGSDCASGVCNPASGSPFREGVSGPWCS